MSAAGEVISKIFLVSAVARAFLRGPRNPYGYFDYEGKAIAEHIAMIPAWGRAMLGAQHAVDAVRAKVGDIAEVKDAQAKIDAATAEFAKVNSQVKVAWNAARAQGMVEGEIPMTDVPLSGFTWTQWIAISLSLATVAVCWFIGVPAVLLACAVAVQIAVDAAAAVVAFGADVGTASGAVFGNAVVAAGPAGLGLLVGIGVFVLALTFLKGSRRGQVA
jgi:hypothetical protein